MLPGEMNPPSAPEKTNKKVSRACNTCRLKRKKCDGLDPCIFCTETKVECSYSREPRRRGPPSGYLRFIETRATLLETLLGLCISKFRPDESLADLTLGCVHTLRSESQTCTQDVWDVHKAAWIDSEAARLLDDLANSFAPFPQRNEADSNFTKPLLPPSTGTRKAAVVSPPSSRPGTAIPKDTIAWSPSSPPNANTFESMASSPSSYFSRESFERTQAPTSIPKPPPEQQSYGVGASSESINFSLSSSNHASFSGSVYPGPTSHTSSYDSFVHIPSDASLDVEMNGDVDQGADYTGSYWREADFEAASTTHEIDFLPPPDQLDVPPAHIIAGVLDVYYIHVHPLYPLLHSRRLLEPSLTAPNLSEGLSCLVLALCSYCGRLSSSADSMFGGDPGKIASDLWYEQARNAVGRLVRNGARLDAVQTLLLLALRDHGGGDETQAWILVGTAIRMGQELDLSAQPSSSKTRLSPEMLEVRQNTWGVSLILDLLLSLQLEKPPAVADTLRSPPALPSPQSDYLFAHSYALCQVISRINLHLHLGFTHPIQQSAAFPSLKQELDSWQQNLPLQFRISLGHQPEQKILELNMLYHVAIILLYRPFYREKDNVGVFLDAASTFNMLLEKYRNVDKTSTPSVSNPSIIYLIFTAAVAHLSGYKFKQQHSMADSTHSTSTLQTQLHLLNCLEALESISGTWDLARRCWCTLDRLMEIEGLKPATGHVQRKRRGGDADHASDSSRAYSPSSSDALQYPPMHMDMSVPSDYFDPSVFKASAWLPGNVGLY